MTAYRRHLPISLACLISLTAGSASFAAGGSALDPYSNVQAPKSAPTSGKNAKGPKKGLLGGMGTVPFAKHAHEVEKKVSLTQDEVDQSQSQTHVSTYGHKSKLVEAPVVSNKPAKVKKTPPPSTTFVSDTAPVAPASKATTAKASSDESVMGGIKAIGEGYKKTFKAATHGMVSSTKAASSAVLSGSKKMGDGIKSSTKASSGVFKKGAGMIGLGGGDKKDGPAPADTKVAKNPAPAATPVKAAVKVAPEKPVAVAEKVEKPKAQDGEKTGMLAKLTHIPKPKLPKIGIPFVGGKKKDKAPVVDKTAGASETGAAYDLDASLASAGKPAVTTGKQKPLQTPIGEELPASALKPEENVKSKIKSKDGLPNLPQGGVKTANNGGGGGGIMGKLWPFGKKKQPSDINGNMQGVAGKPHFQVPM